MTERDFVYWLNGFFELTSAQTLTEQQIQIIKDHLKQVFKKETPDYTLLKSPTFTPWDPGTTIC